MNKNKVKIIFENFLAVELERDDYQYLLIDGVSEYYLARERGEKIKRNKQAEYVEIVLTESGRKRVIVPECITLGFPAITLEECLLDEIAIASIGFYDSEGKRVDVSALIGETDWVKNPRQNYKVSTDENIGVLTIGSPKNNGV